MRQKQNKPKQAKDISTEWRSCMVYVWSPAMDCWVKQLNHLTIKPGESTRDKEWEIAIERKVRESEVILSPCLDAE